MKIPKDKLLHLAAGTAAALAASVILLTSSVLIPLYAALLAGAVKEYTDRAHGCRWDWADLGCTALPGLILTLILVLLHL